MKPSTQTILIAAGAAVAALVVYETVNSINTTNPGGPPSVGDSLKWGAAIATAGGAAWFLLLLFP
jgi:hypothetical protein